jgi:hypothetical protein
MKNTNIILILITISLICLLGCNSPMSKKDITILNQELIYDSVNFKARNFKVNVYSTIEFDRHSITRKEYNDFLLIIDIDTFPLIPEVNFLREKNNGNKITVKYLSLINFESKEFKNDSISGIINKSSKIINSDGQEINRNNLYDIKSLVTLHHPNANGRKLQ